MSNRLSQLAVEVLVLSDTPVTFRVSQLPVEVGVLSDVPVTFRLSQLAVEVLIDTSVVPPTAVETTQPFVWMPV